jgi:hypothetical protein
MKEPSILLTKAEQALILGLLLQGPKDRELCRVQISDEERQLAARLLREFVGPLTCKLLGAPQLPFSSPQILK